MSRRGCDDCGTLLERNGVCPNCDEAAFALDWDDPEHPTMHTQEFLDEAAAGSSVGKEWRYYVRRRNSVRAEENKNQL